MKIMAFNGSARKDGNTAILINYVLKELQQEGIETELFQLAGQKIQGCMACYKCFENKDRQCVFKDDILNTCVEKMAEADKTAQRRITGNRASPRQLHDVPRSAAVAAAWLEEKCVTGYG